MKKPDLMNSTWPERMRYWLETLETYNADQVQSVLYDLAVIEAKRGVLSFGERKIERLAKEILEAKRSKHLIAIQGGRQ